MKGLTSKKLLPALLTVLSIQPVTAQADYSWSYQYNEQGLLSQTDGPRTDLNDITQYSYDAQGRLISVTNALGHTSHLSNYTLLGSPQTVVDANGLETSLEYDPLDRLVLQTIHSQQGDVITGYTYTAVGLLSRVNLPDGSWLAYEYDDARRLTAVVNSLGEKISYTLDPMGNRTEEKISSASGLITQQLNRSYDEMGRLLQLVGASGQTTQLSYDVNSNQTGQIDGNYNSHQQAFDALNRLVKITDPYQQLTELTYDPQDNLTAVTDPRGITTRYEYDGLGRVIRLISPDSGETTYQYDTAGNVIQQTDARGVVTQYAYDALNRLISKTYPADSSHDLILIYDQTESYNGQPHAGIGRLTSLREQLGVIHYRYDDRGNLLEKYRTISLGEHSSNHIIRYQWDLSDRLISTRYPSGLTVNYQRNNVGQITAVRYQGLSTETVVADQISYQPYGGIKQLNWSNGVTLDRTFDLDGRLSSQDLGSLQSLSYQYDGVSNITQVEQLEIDTEVNLNKLFGYDALNRLTNEQSENTEKNYQYDAVGNRTERKFTFKNDEGEVETSTQNLGYTDDSNRLANLDQEALSYDSSGNTLAGLIKKQQYQYDHKGRLLSVSENGREQARYYYNGSGERVIKLYTHNASAKTDQSSNKGKGKGKADNKGKAPVTIQPALTLFHYNTAGQLIQETYYDKTGTKKYAHHYIWLDNQPLAYIKQQFHKDGELNSEVLVYIHSDHLNTPRLATDATQQIVWRWDSDAFGLGKADKDPDGDGENVDVALRFPGQYFDRESGLHYNYYRDYDPRTGRYIQSDPIGLAGGLNTYAYSLGNPLSYIDPLGLDVAIVTGSGHGSNPFGHTGMLVTGKGVYSYGTKHADGSSAAAYLKDRLALENNQIVILTNLTKEQEAQLIEEYKKKKLGDYDFATHNCATVINDSMGAIGAGFPYGNDYGIPTPAFADTQADLYRLIHGGTQITLPKGTTQLPSILNQFEPSKP